MSDSHEQNLPFEVIGILLSNPFKPDARLRLQQVQTKGGLVSREDAVGEWRKWHEQMNEKVGSYFSHEDICLALCVHLLRDVPAESQQPLITKLAKIFCSEAERTRIELAIRAERLRSMLETELRGISAVLQHVRHEVWSASFGPSLLETLELQDLIRKTPVLILGESGVGKQVVADAIQFSVPGTLSKTNTWSPAAYEPVHLAALPDTLVQDALFGHEKGAYSGALQQQKGVLERCASGVVFLDEVADLAPVTQVSLLRALQSRRVRRLGAVIEVEASPRVLSGTLKDLERLVAEGTFRGDLYFRLAAVRIQVPALREHRADIQHILDSEIQRIGPSIRVRVKSELEAFLNQHSDYGWPGNVRELVAQVAAVALGFPPRRSDVQATVPSLPDVNTGPPNKGHSARIDTSSVGSKTEACAIEVDDTPQFGQSSAGSAGESSSEPMPDPLAGSEKSGGQKWMFPPELKTLARGELTLEEAKRTYAQWVRATCDSDSEAARRLGIDRATVARLCRDPG